EPRPVPALERDFLIVHDHRIHETASAATRPLTAAPSIVAGKPVSTQSPARNNPEISVRHGGRGGWPGASENVARRSRTTVARRRQRPAPHRWAPSLRETDRAAHATAPRTPRRPRAAAHPAPRFPPVRRRIRHAA